MDSDLGRKVVCYIDAGTWEDWRPDAAQFTTSLLGRSNGWPGERWLDVRWDVEEESPQRFPARIKVHSVNEPGTLAQVAQVIAEHDGNIDNVRMQRGSPDFTELLIDLEVYDLKHLTAIIGQLRAKDVVAQAERVNG